MISIRNPPEEESTIRDPKLFASGSPASNCFYKGLLCDDIMMMYKGH